jgi:DNA-binding response OmpR family regulator
MADKKRIVIAEDDKLLCDILVEKFEKNGYVVGRAEDGDVALEKMRSAKPDIVLLDLLMPRKGGMEVLEEMHRDASLKSVPVIIISNAGQLKEMGRARELGARDFIIKTVFDPNQVLERVGQILENPEASQKEWEMRSQNVTGVGAISNNNNMPEETKPTTDANKAKPFVLVIEDDKFLRELLVKKLSAEGFEVENALDGETAFGILAKKTPNIILLDLILPNIDGFEILGRVRKDAKTATTPVIIFSNLGEKADIDKAMGLGATDFMVKANFTLDEIVAKIHSIIG